MPGRINANTASRALVAGDVALGVGWGDGAVVLAIASGSNDQRGAFTVTSVGSNQAQATATVTVTFAQAYEDVPVVVACRGGGDAGPTTKVAVSSRTATGFVLVNDTIPVVAELTQLYYQVLG
jgi:hypothetical protein